MALNTEFAKELEQAVIDSMESETKGDEDVASDTASTDDVGTEAVSDEVSNSGNAASDGSEPNDVTKGSDGEGTGESGSTNSRAGDEASRKLEPTISDAVLTTAVEHGISLEDAKLFPSEDALRRAVQTIRNSVEKLSPKEPVQEEDIFANVPKLDSEQYEPEVVKMFDAVIDVVKKQQEQIKELRGQAKSYGEEVLTANRRAAEKEVTTWFDNQVEKLGDGFKDVLGVGGTEALAPNSLHKVKRDELANKTAALLRAYMDDPHPPTRDKIFEEAARLVFADKYAKMEQEKVISQMEKRRKQHIQRAGGQHRAKASGVAEEAIQLLESQYKF